MSEWPELSTPAQASGAAVALRPVVRSRSVGASRWTWLVWALIPVIVLGCMCIGPVSISAAQMWHVVTDRLTGRAPADPIIDQIVWTVRIPRALLGALVGAALAVTGVVIQAVVRNPLADPYLIGVMPGAGLGAALVIVAGAAVAGLSVSVMAFVGALVAFTVTFGLGRRSGSWPPNRLILAGVAVGYLFTSATFFLQVKATPNQLQRILFWSLGSVSGASWTQLPLLTAVTLGGVGWLMTVGSRLNALVGGDDLAVSVGIDVGRFQLRLMVLSALLTGAVVAVAGGIGFVGLVVPHVARSLVGVDHRRSLPAALLLGAAFVPLADVAARMLLRPTELPIGIVTAAIGAPFFLWLLVAGPRRSAG